MERKRLVAISYFPREELPEWWGKAIEAKELLRLEEVGMNCGLEYTSFPLFKGILPYSRYVHSLGVGEIVYRFSHDPKQALSGLYHDIASPCFAHVIDFLHGDYQSQESTEEGTSKIIAKSKDIQDLLGFLNLSREDVDDYHLYPIADNDSPKLSADRLEYTLSNALNLLRLSREEVSDLYEAISLLPSGELGFLDERKAKRFACIALSLGRIYCCDEDRYSMEVLARLIKKAIAMGVLCEGDLYQGEPELIAKLLDSPLKGEWENYCAMAELVKSEVPQEGFLKIRAKKRYIDPLVGEKRLSEIDPEFKREADEYLAQDFDVYLKRKG